MKFIELYFSYVKLFIKARAEYRVSFFTGAFSNFFSYLITYLTFYIIINQFGSMDGWDFYDLCLLYSINLLTYAISAMLFWAVFGIEHEILAGNLDILLIRPISLIKSLICKKFTDTFIGQIIVSIIFLTIAIVNQQNRFSFVKFLYLLVAIMGGILIHSATMVFFGSISFWTKRSLFLADLVYYDFRTFLEYPVTVFPIWVKFVFTFILPWALIGYYPSLILLDKCNSIFDFVLGLMSPAAGIGIFILAKTYFYYSLCNYSSSGS